MGTLSSLWGKHVLQFMIHGHGSNLLLFCDPVYTMKTWITFIIHIEEPVRSYEVLLEQRQFHLILADRQLFWREGSSCDIYRLQD